MVLPFNVALYSGVSVAALFAASGADAYAVGGNAPEFVADFAGVLNSGTEYYRSGGSDTTFSSVFTHSGLVAPATMTDSDGVLKWGAHNLLLQSNDFNTTWLKNQLTGVTSNSTGTLDPDGTNTADLIIPNGNNDASHGVFVLSRPVTSGATYEVAIYAKAGGYDGINIIVDAASGKQAGFNLTAGTVDGSAGLVSSSIVADNNGFYKCSVVAAATDSAWDIRIFVGPASSINADGRFAAYAGDTASGVYVFGAHWFRSDLGGMVNNPDRGDSYVPTTTAARFLPRRNNYIYNGTSWEKAGILIEPAAATNLALNCRTPLSWSVDFFVNDTDSATTGIDGVSNSAGTITAAQTGGCFIGQDITVSNTIVSSVYLKRLSGTGVVALTQGEAVGSELVTNGTFDSDVSGWTAQANTTLAWNASGAMDVTSTSSISGAYTSFATVSGKVYKLTVGSISGGAAYLRIGTTPGGSDVGNSNGLTSATSGPNPYYFIAKSSTTYLTLSAFSGSTTVTYDDVSVTEVASAALTEASAWERLITPAASLTNPRVCIVFANNTDSVGVDFLQVEVGSVATSPILTTGSTVTRAAETLTVAGSSLPANTTGVSVQMQGRMTYADLGTEAQRTFWRWYNGASDFLLCDLDTDGADTGEVNANQSDTTGGAGTVAIDAYSPGINVAYNIASRHSNTDINLAVDGTAGTADTTPTALHDASSDTFQVAHALQGSVGMLRVWGVGLSDTDLESAT